MNQFSIFTRLYAIAFLLDLLEEWRYPNYGNVMILIIVMVLTFTRVTRFKFLIYLICNTIFLLKIYPNGANHHNLLLYLNIFLILGVFYSWLNNKTRLNEDDYYEMMRPFIRLSTISVYFWAGFHKLNIDFFNPNVSCSSRMLHRLLDMLQSDVFGLPVILVVITLNILLLWIAFKKLQKKYFHNSILSSQLSQVIILVFLVLGGIFCYKVFFESTHYHLIPYPILNFNILLVLVWELFGSLLLFIPRLQAPLIAFTWLMHASLAMIGFVDFSAIALSLLFTFIPDQYWEILKHNMDIKLLRWEINRSHVYFIFALFICFVTALYYLASVDYHVKIVTGAIFNLSVFVFFWPIISAQLAPTSTNRSKWQGVKVINRSMPRFMVIALISLSCFAFLPYLGLRTAGNFSMFSNLRTEGIRSNHLLLGSNPFKIWNYQEDVVNIVELKIKGEKGLTSKKSKLQGYLLPMVEFRKILYRWGRRKRIVKMTFEYQGKQYKTEDIVNDPIWRTDQETWEMKHMIFREIQPTASLPNRCRW